MHGYYTSHYMHGYASVLMDTFDGDPKADSHIADGAVVDVEVWLIFPLVASLVQLKPQLHLVTGHPLTTYTRKQAQQ